MKRFTSAVLAALLLLFAVAPVPSNVYALDRLRYERAHANPLVIGGVELGYEAAVTLLGMAGVYVGATTLDEYGPQMQALVDDFTAYVNANGYFNEYNCDLSQYVDETGQNINVKAAYDAGFYDMVQSYLGSENARAILADGTVSNAIDKPVHKEYQGHAFYTVDQIPYMSLYLTDSAFSRRVLTDGMQVIGYQYLEHVDGAEKYRVWLASGSTPKNFTYNENDGNPYLYASSFTKYDFKVKDNALVGGSVGGNYGMYVYTDNSGAMFSKSAVISVGGSVLENVAGVSPFAGVFSPANVSARIGEIANGVYDKVRIFNPTAEQLEAGYDFQTIVSGELAGISTGIEGLDRAINTLIGVTSAISSWLSSTLFGQYCANVTTWLGDTPFGNVMGTVIDGVSDIPGHVDDAGQVVAGGIAALPGAIEGVLERTFPDSVAIPGVLEQTLSGVQAIPASIQSVIDAVNSGVLDLTGAIEGVMEMRPQWPKWESPEGEVEAFFVPTGTTDGVQVKLEDKVPFCYVVRSQAALTSMFANFSSNRSFYLDMEIPNAGSVHFDGESVLSQNLGLTDIATTIRIALTGLLCFALLYRAYKVVEETQGSV